MAGTIAPRRPLCWKGSAHFATLCLSPVNEDKDGNISVLALALPIFARLRCCLPWIPPPGPGPPAGTWLSAIPSEQRFTLAPDSVVPLPLGPRRCRHPGRVCGGLVDRHHFAARLCTGVLARRAKPLERTCVLGRRVRRWQRLRERLPLALATVQPARARHFAAMSPWFRTLYGTNNPSTVVARLNYFPSAVHIGRGNRSAVRTSGFGHVQAQVFLAGLGCMGNRRCNVTTTQALNTTVRAARARLPNG